MIYQPAFPRIDFPEPTMRLLLQAIWLALIPVAQSTVISCYYKYNDPPVSEVIHRRCTHIILIGNSVLDHLGHFQAPKEEIVDDFLTLKKADPNVKLLLCQTGENRDFSTLVSTDETIGRYANESASYLRSKGLDGIDLDWEFPAWSWDSRKTDRWRFTLLLQALRNEYKKDLLVTAAVSGPPTITRKAYDIPEFNKYLDLVHVMNYDFHVFSFSNPAVGFNAPLRRNRGELGLVGQMNSEASIATYLSLGLWKNITVHGMPTYNLAFLLVNRFIHKPYSPAEKSLDGYEKQAKICEMLNDKSRYTYVWNEKAASPYIYGTDKVWVSAEDERSVAAKAAFAMESDLAGVMIFHIGADDYNSTCGNGPYPLMNTIYRIVNAVENRVVP